jgi:hypothetical protein
MVSSAGGRDFEAQPKRNKAAIAISTRIAAPVTVDPSIHPNGRLGLKKAAGCDIQFHRRFEYDCGIEIEFDSPGCLQGK